MSATIDWASDGEVIMNPIILNKENTESRPEGTKSKPIDITPYRTDVEWVMCLACNKKFSKTNIDVHMQSPTHLYRARMLLLKESKK